MKLDVFRCHSFYLFSWVSNGSCCLAGFFSRKLQPTTYAILIATLQAGVTSYSSCVLFKKVTLSMASSDASMRVPKLMGHSKNQPLPSVIVISFAFSR